MLKKFLHRNDAPFTEDFWEKIDVTVIESAKSQLSARQIIHVEEPYGLGFKAIEGSDTVQNESEDITISTSKITPVVQIQKCFSIPIRDIANFEQFGKILDLKAAAEAAISCAKQEESIIYNGSKKLGITGLLNTSGIQSIKLQPWETVGTAVDDIIKAITKLDDIGFHGPYTMGLAPQQYNLLFRRYPNGNMTELDHLKTIITKKIVKIPTLSSGGLILSYGQQFTSVILGQDLMTGYLGPTGLSYSFTILESLALRLLQPSAVCILK